jgi:hypothetical protein
MYGRGANRNRVCPISERLVAKSAIADLDAGTLQGSLRSHLRVTELKAAATRAGVIHLAGKSLWVSLRGVEF